MTFYKNSSVVGLIDTLSKAYESESKNKIFLDQVLDRMSKAQSFLDIASKGLELPDKLSFDFLKQLTAGVDVTDGFNYELGELIETHYNAIHREYECAAYNEFEKFIESIYPFLYNVIIKYRKKGLVFADLFFGAYDGRISFGDKTNGGLVEVGTTNGKLNYKHHLEPERYFFNTYIAKLESVQAFIDLTSLKVAPKTQLKQLKRELKVVKSFIQSLDINIF